MQTEAVLTGPALRLHLLELLVANYDAMDGSDVVATAREAYAFVVGEEQSATTSLSVNIPELSIEVLAEQMRRQPMPIVLDDEAEVQSTPVSPKIERPEVKATLEPTESALPSKRPKEYATWSPDRVERLERLLAAALPYKEVAERMGGGLTASAIAAQASLRKLNKKYPRSRNGLPLFEPYPLNAPWPRPVTSPIVIIDPSARKKQGVDKFNSRVKQLATGAISGWETEINVGEFKSHLDAGETFVDLAERYRAPSWQSVRAFALAHNMLAKSASGTWVRPGNLTAVSAPSGHEKMRKCLRCGTDFHSEGPGNRICPSCKPAVNAAYEPPSGRVAG